MLLIPVITVLVFEGIPKSHNYDLLSPTCRVHTGGVTGLIFAPSGDNLYSSSSNGSLALYDCHDDEGCRVVRAMGNTVAKGERYGPKALSLSDDGSRLAFIGPMEFTVTVLDAHTMDEVGNSVTKFLHMI